MADREITTSIVVVGPCASGKSTLVRGLTSLGYAARVCAQEHSEVPTLWRHQGIPVLVALTAELETVRLRRDPRWPIAVHAAQIRRLTSAFANADVVIATDHVSSADVLVEAVAAIERRRAY